MEAPPLLCPTCLRLYPPTLVCEVCGKEYDSWFTEKEEAIFPGVGWFHFDVFKPRQARFWKMHDRIYFWALLFRGEIRNQWLRYADYLFTSGLWKSASNAYFDSRIPGSKLEQRCMQVVNIVAWPVYTLWRKYRED